MEKSVFDRYTEEFVKKFDKYSYYDKPIESNGSIENDGKFYINYSSILTRLIQEAGRYCESYASDLFIDWNWIEKELQNGSIESGTQLFGFREMGVDHNSYIFSRAIESPRYFEYNYRSIWRLDTEVIRYEDYWRSDKIKMILYRVHPPYYGYELDKFFQDYRKEETEERAKKEAENEELQPF